MIREPLAVLEKLEQRMRTIQSVAGQCSVEGPGGTAALMAAAEAERAREWADDLASVIRGIKNQAVEADISEIRDHENNGPLESTDLWVRGRGISLLVNIERGSRGTYSLMVDGKQEKGGGIHYERASASPSLVTRQREEEKEEEKMARGRTPGDS